MRHTSIADHLFDYLKFKGVIKKKKPTETQNKQMALKLKQLDILSLIIKSKKGSFS